MLPGVDSALRVLDLTNFHLHDLSEIDIPESLTEIDLTCNRLQSIDTRILNLKGLKSLSFRQNLLTDEIETTKLDSKTCLENLELRDNQLQRVPNLAEFENLQSLELSYNQIRSMQPLTSLNAGSLESLFMASNKITAIESLGTFSKLRMLEFGFNRIRSIENIAHLHQLEELWLGRNRITAIGNLSTLINLKKISIQSNRLDSMKGLESCINLEEVYLSHNGITKLEGLMTLERLKVLDASNNRISKLEGLDSLAKLEDLWLNDNQVTSWTEAQTALEVPKQTLTTIYLENNPLAKDPDYKQRIRALLPNLTQLDADDLLE